LCKLYLQFFLAVTKYRLLHLLLVALTIGKSSRGKVKVYLLEASKNLAFCCSGKYLKDAIEIRSTIESLAATQEHVVLLSLGISDNFTKPNSSDEEDDSEDTNVLKFSDVKVNSALIESNFNWYELVAQDIP